MEGSRWLHATLLDQVLGLKSETWNDTWRGVSHNAPFNLFTYARVEVDGYASLQITQALLVHVSYGELKMGHFH